LDLVGGFSLMLFLGLLTTTTISSWMECSKKRFYFAARGLPQFVGRYLPGIAASLGFLFIVGMDWGALSADSMTYSGDNVAMKARSA
jgi:hypothetical protein